MNDAMRSPSDENEDAKKLIEDLLQIHSAPEVLEALKSSSTTTSFTAQESKNLKDYVKIRESVSPHNHAHKDYYTNELYIFF
jgi:hypothetical protein